MPAIKKRIKALSALSLAAAAGMGTAEVHAVTLTSYYVNAVITTTPTPTKEVLTGTGVNTTLVALSASNPTIDVPPGDYIGYGIAAVLTNNVNPNGGSTYGDSFGDTIVDPTNLGLADIGYVVLNVSANDINGSILQPVTNGIRGTAGTAVQYNTTAVVRGIGKAGLTKGRNGYSFFSHDVGDAEPNSGLVGAGFQIFEGNPSVDPTSTVGYNSLTYFAGTTPNFTAAATVFDSLDYQALSFGSETVTLQPKIDPTATQYWKETSPGTSTVPAAYQATFFSSTDTINPLPALTVNVGEYFPPPVFNFNANDPIYIYSPLITNGTGANQGIFSTGTSTLTLSGSSIAQVTGIKNSIAGAGLSTGEVVVDGFGPTPSSELFAMDVEVNGTQASATQLNYLIAAAGDIQYFAITSTLANDPFPSNYNLFLILTSPDIVLGSGTLGFSFYSPGFDLSSYEVTAIAAGGSPVPEPMSLGVLVLGGIGLVGRRRR